MHAPDIAISATRNQDGRPIVFISRILQGSEVRNPAIEKEAIAIIKTIRKWSHLLLRQTFTIVKDQRSVAFMLDSRSKLRVTKYSIEEWSLHLILTKASTDQGTKTLGQIPSLEHFAEACPNHRHLKHS